MATKISVIIPYVNEYPQNVFTVSSLHEELLDIDHEIIVINNTGTDKSKDMFDAAAKGQPWLKSIEYNDKLSHWNAKNYGVSASTGDILFFCDAHCIIGKNSLVDMLDYYVKNHDDLNGSMHLPITYQILEWRKLIYTPLFEPDNGVLHYRFCNMPSNDNPIFEVPCMSTCGMMISRTLYNRFKGWPSGMGIYGGGENYFNYVMAILGMKKWIYSPGVLHHYGEKRGYSWNYNDYHKNRMIATYCFGDEAWLKRYINHIGFPDPENQIENIINISSYHKKIIESNQTQSIEEWLQKWQ